MSVSSRRARMLCLKCTAREEVVEEEGVGAVGVAVLEGAVLQVVVLEVVVPVDAEVVVLAAAVAWEVVVQIWAL